MEKYTDYSITGKVNRFISGMDIKSMAAMLAVELGMFLMAVYKGVGKSFFPVMLLMMVFTIIGCMMIFAFKADVTLFMIELVLMNLGFLIQQIQSGDDIQIDSFIKKLSIVIIAALISAAVYTGICEWLKKKYFILAMMLMQYGMCLMMILAGKMIGSSSAQGALISFKGITLFEVVKILCIFVNAGLLCSEDDEILLFKKYIDKEYVMFFHTVILSMFLVLCNELGTLMIIYITGLIELWLFGKKRKQIMLLLVVSFLGFVLFWFLSTEFLYPMLRENPGCIPGPLGKLVKRFGTVFHPEYYRSDDGYQGTRALEAISIGGYLGLDTERYRIALPEASSDLVFANVIQTCGLFMGYLMLLFFFAFLKKGVDLARRYEDTYYQAVSMFITSMIIVETIIHVGYNMAVLPITGIPLYFVSQGFTAIITGVSLVSVLLVISVKCKKESEM